MIANTFTGMLPNFKEAYAKASKQGKASNYIAKTNKLQRLPKIRALVGSRPNR